MTARADMLRSFFEAGCPVCQAVPYNCRPQTAGYRQPTIDLFPVIFDSSIFIRKPSTFSCKKEGEVRGSENWKWRWIFTFDGCVYPVQQSVFLFNTEWFHFFVLFTVSP